jgi:hypothetical protein
MSSQLLLQSNAGGSSEVYVTNDLVVAGAVKGDSFTNTHPGFTQTLSFGQAPAPNGTYTVATVPSAGPAKIVLKFSNTGITNSGVNMILNDLAGVAHPVDLTPLAEAGYKFASVSIDSVTVTNPSAAGPTNTVELHFSTWANWPNYGGINGNLVKSSDVWTNSGTSVAGSQTLLLGLGYVTPYSIPLVKSPAVPASGGNPAIAPAYPSLYLYLATGGAGQMSIQFNVTVAGVL